MPAMPAQVSMSEVAQRKAAMTEQEDSELKNNTDEAAQDMDYQEQGEEEEAEDDPAEPGLFPTKNMMLCMLNSPQY